MRLYNAVTREPVEVARLLRDEVLVRRYRMPERVGSLYLPSGRCQDRLLRLRPHADAMGGAYGQRSRRQGGWHACASGQHSADAKAVATRHIPHR